MTPPLNRKAEAAIVAFAADCGRDVWKMQAACETYLGQYLADYPVEMELLIAALRVGVPKRIAAQDARVGYDDFLAQLAEKFAAAAHTDREAAGWAVGAWATVLGKPAGYRPPEDEPPAAGRVYVDDFQPKGGEGFLKFMMAAIVTAGGFLGGVAGGAMLPLVMLATEVATEYHTKGGPMAGKDRVGNYSNAVTGLAIFLAMVVVGGASGLGALGGWLLGRGAERPWATFGTAFMTALGSNLVVMFCLGPFFGAPIQFAIVFGSTFRSAARGGGD